MKTVAVFLGTRPEAIKLCPLVRELKDRGHLRVLVCHSGQHREMTDPILRAFDVIPDANLMAMQEGQSLAELSARVLRRADGFLTETRPDLALVHGDTATAHSAALACFFRRVPLGHVEAGLRTHRLDQPFPEELNRRAIALTAAYHFAPTPAARENLLREGVEESRVFVTGNTVIDALNTTVRPDFAHPLLDWAGDARLVLLTLHRRELGEADRHGLLRAIRQVTEEHPDVKLLCPLHPSPAVRQAVTETLGDHPRICLTEPLPMEVFHNLMAKSYLLLSDSGGIQEEAPALGKPLLVLRQTTERPEGVVCGSVRLVGTAPEGVADAFRELLNDPAAYARMAKVRYPFGDGSACCRIAEILERVASTTGIPMPS